MVTAGGATVPLENWRSSLFNFAAEYEMARGSPSRMFWDAIDPAGLMVLTGDMPDSSRESKNHWYIEPGIIGGSSTTADATTGYFDGQLFHAITFANIEARQMLHFDSRYKNDPDYPAHPDRVLRGRIEEAELKASWKNGFVSIGRKNRNWGPFPNRSLILSNVPYTYDAVEGQVTSRLFEFRHLFVPFTSQRSTLDSDNGSTYDRYLTAHSLNVVFSKWVTVGITETVLFTRQGRFPDLAYVNPVSIYSVINTNYEGNGNLMLGLQWNVHPGLENVSFRGQLLFDDFQVDNKIATDKEPTHWGMDAGLFWSNPLRNLQINHLLKLEGTYASEWLYTVPDANAQSGERYIVNRRSLGLAGTNGLLIKGGASACVGKGYVADLSLSYSQRGGNTPLTSWQDNQFTPGLPVSINRKAEKRGAVQASFLCFYRNMVNLQASADVGWIRNRDNIPSGGFVFDPVFALQCGVHCSPFFLLDKK